MKPFNIRTLTGVHGDLVQTLTREEEIRELDFTFLATVMPDGTVVKSPEELLQAIIDSPLEEIEVLRFPPLAGG